MATNGKTTVFGNSLVWFGAAVSIAEILTGTLFAPLGFAKAFAAIVIGHVIGCVLLYAAGLIGANKSLSAMETAKLTFGERGGQLFASLNVIQLVGWTAVMVASGAAAAQSIYAFGHGAWPWALLLGGLILVWIWTNIRTLEKLNIGTMLLLFLLSLLLSRVVFKTHTPLSSEETLGFGDALELSIAMPVSWLPLIADYTSTASRPKLTCFVSTLVYFIVSCWMYIIGVAATLYAGEGDIAVIMTRAGLGIYAVIIVILSTVTTTFLDVYSAGISAQSIHRSLPQKLTATACCVLGVILAIVCNTSAFENFLYWIGSVFVPMITVQVVDAFFPFRPSALKTRVITNLTLWGIGFVLYRIALYLTRPCGSTIPDILATSIVSLIVLWRIARVERTSALPQN